MRMTARHWIAFGAFVALLIPTARADVTIIGALSNMDVPNETPEICDEFEIEFEGPHPEDINGFWRNYNYGLPTMVALPGNTGVLITYRLAGHTTQPGAVEHFGVHMANFNLITNRVFRWKHNGVVVTSGPGHPPILIPRTVVLPTGEVVEAVENESPEEVIWVRRSTIIVPREVALAELMPDDPLIQQATPVEVELQKLEPGEILENVEPLDPEDYVQTQIIVVETFADVATWNPQTQDWDHAPGVLMSRAMNASVVQTTICTERATIVAEPQNTAGPFDGAAFFGVVVDSPPASGEVVYQWRHNGIDMVGEDNDTLGIDPITFADAGTYDCAVTNDCGTVYSAVATLIVIPMRADLNCDAEVDNGDIDAFVLALINTDGYDAAFPHCDIMAADVNADGVVDNGDIDGFVACILHGGCR